MGKHNYIKSPLNYTGGKYKLLPQIIPIIRECGKVRRFVDMFTGGVNVAINMADYDVAENVFANDFERHIIELYKCLQENSIETVLDYIYKRIQEYQLSDTNAEGYNGFREYYNKSQEKYPLDLFILICHSFNHQFRFNTNGEFNMPFGKNRSKFNPNIEKNLINFHKSIQYIVFSCKDFRELKIDNLKSDDYVYCDPPYLITCATYNEKDGWNNDDEKALLSLLDTVNEKGTKFGLSNVLYNKGKTNDILIEWSKKYNVRHLDYTYKNCNYHTKDKDSKPDEVIITNY